MGCSLGLLKRLMGWGLFGLVIIEFAIALFVTRLLLIQVDDPLKYLLSTISTALLLAFPVSNDDIALS